jgi:methionyl-tRNA formyltransferase
MDHRVERVVFCAHGRGMRQLLEHFPAGVVRGLVVPAVRPEEHAAVQRLAEERRLPLAVQVSPASPGYADFISRVMSWSPQMLVVNSYSMLIRADVLDRLPFGGINIHGGLLPRQRGCHPVQWAIIGGEAETGATMHFMTTEFDTGDIIAQRRVPILFEDTWVDVQERIWAAAGDILAEQVPRLLSGRATGTAQDESRARYLRKRYPEDGAIDWDRPVLDIYNLVRALVRPLPGAFYFRGYDKVLLDRYLPLSAVAALKYGEGGYRLVADRVSLTLPRAGDPESTVPGAASDRLTFQVNDLITDTPLGRCQLMDIRPDSGSARFTTTLDVRDDDGMELLRQARRLVVNFGFDELRLKEIEDAAPET